MKGECNPYSPVSDSRTALSFRLKVETLLTLNHARGPLDKQSYTTATYP